MKATSLLISRLFTLTLFTFALSDAAFAGVGSINFTLAPNNPSAIPTLSDTMMIVLSILLFVVAFRVSKQKNTHANKFFMLAIGASILISAVSGMKLVSNVNAGQQTLLDVNLTTGANNSEFQIPRNESLRFNNISATSINFRITLDQEDFNFPECGYRIDQEMPALGDPRVKIIEGIAQTATGILPTGSFIIVNCYLD